MFDGLYHPFMVILGMVYLLTLSLVHSHYSDDVFYIIYNVTST